MAVIQPRYNDQPFPRIASPRKQPSSPSSRLIADIRQADTGDSTALYGAPSSRGKIMRCRGSLTRVARRSSFSLIGLLALSALVAVNLLSAAPGRADTPD
jgi:hypothetical protein